MRRDQDPGPRTRPPAPGRPEANSTSGGQHPSRQSLELRIGPAAGGGEFRPDAGDTTLVELKSKPPGAVVFLNGKLLCRDTAKGCARMLPKGRQRVRMEMERHLAREADITVTDDLVLECALEPNTGRLTVESTPSGRAVHVDGREAGTTPLRDLEVEPGRHRVSVRGPCDQEAGQELTLAREEEKLVSVEPEPIPAGIRVLPEDDAGNVVQAEVWVDGQRAGAAPGTLTVSACAKTLEVRHASLGSASAELKLEPRKTVELKPQLWARPRVEIVGDMVRVPAGTFWYGCNKRVDSGCFDEDPGRRVSLPAFASTAPR